MKVTGDTKTEWKQRKRGEDLIQAFIYKVGGTDGGAYCTFPSFEGQEVIDQGFESCPVIQ